MPADPVGSAVHEVTRNLLTSAQQNARRGMWPRAIGHPALRAACLEAADHDPRDNGDDGDEDSDSGKT
jgi:hypothetical protein